MAGIGVCLQRAGRFEDAGPLLAEALDYALDRWGESHPTTFLYMHNYAFQLWGEGDLEGAESLFRDCIAVGRELEPEPRDSILLAELNLGEMLMELERLDEAHELLTTAHLGLTSLFDDSHPLALRASESLDELAAARDRTAARDG
ncbi:MAG: tetratricopeptide repeat protein [Planctomycetota bacterium]|nr:MAG: tetratricopeptide repeat protein [Planctomycetota bacterium]